MKKSRMNKNRTKCFDSLSRIWGERQQMTKNGTKNGVQVVRRVRLLFTQIKTNKKVLKYTSRTQKIVFESKRRFNKHFKNKFYFKHPMTIVT